MTGGFDSVVASELTEVTDLDDLTDLMLGNLMLRIGIAQTTSAQSP